jgi:hypothetical protein
MLYIVKAKVHARSYFDDGERRFEVGLLLKRGTAWLVGISYPIDAQPGDTYRLMGKGVLQRYLKRLPQGWRFFDPKLPDSQDHIEELLGVLS